MAVANASPMRRQSFVAEGALATRRKPQWWRGLFQLANTVPTLVLLWWAMLMAVDYSYALVLVLALPAAGLVVRLFTVQHDCGHGSFFNSRAINNALGAVIGVITLTPYRYWRYTHALHHAHHGKLEHRHDLGYFELMTVDEYRRHSTPKQFSYRLYRSPLVFLIIGPLYQFFWKHRLPLDLPRDRRTEWLSILGTNLGIALFVSALAGVVGWPRFLKVQLPISYLAALLGMWLFYVQHNFEGSRVAPEKQWAFDAAALEGSSFYDLPRVLAWFTGDIGLHHIHHLDARVPNYRLRECVGDPAVAQVPRLTLAASLRGMRLKLWDERRGRLVSFAEIDGE